MLSAVILTFLSLALAAVHHPHHPHHPHNLHAGVDRGFRKHGEPFSGGHKPVYPNLPHHYYPTTKNTTRSAWCDCLGEVPSSKALEIVIDTLDDMVTTLPMDMEPGDYYFALGADDVVAFICNSGNVTMESPKPGAVKGIRKSVGKACGDGITGTVQLAPPKWTKRHGARLDWGYMVKDLGDEDSVCELAESWAADNCELPIKLPLGTGPVVLGQPA